MSGAFHRGELELQERAGSRERLAAAGPRVIRDFMPEQHRELFGKLPWLLAGTLDAQGRSWASVLVGHPGFVHSPDERTLRITARAAFGDPLGANLRLGAPIGLLGIELETRRRNRMNGTVVALREGSFDVRVGQSFGNCPQYIQAREPYFTADPDSVSLPRALRTEGRELSSRAQALIRGADTFFIATAAEGASGDDPVTGCDISHRGGKPGFVSIETEGASSVLYAPDFRGNNFFNTLGNLMHNPSAGLLFVDFDSGDVLSLTGTARVFWDAPRRLRFEPQTGAWLAGAVPMRWSPPQFARELEAGRKGGPPR
jgi:predicted pyridoxine 5'-phosphate oxidase superfamily flavin-nucleotide-binding protein